MMAQKERADSNVSERGKQMKKEKNPNIDSKQSMRDIFRKNQYELDDRFVIRDGKRYKCAVICPGGGYSLVCSFAEGALLAGELNKQGISAFIVYYRVRKKAGFPKPQNDLAKAIREIHARKDFYCLDMDGSER